MIAPFPRLFPAPDDMFETLWIVLTLLQAPDPPAVSIGLPDDVHARTIAALVVPPAGPMPGTGEAAPQTAGATAPPAGGPVAAVPPPSSPPPSPRPRVVRGKAELSYVSTGGTTDTQTIGTAGELLVTPNAWRIETKLAYLRNKVNDEINAKRLTGQFRAARKIGESSELFGRAAYLRNTFTGINNSWDAAVGVTALLLDQEPQRLAIDSGFGYLTEDRTGGLGRDLASVDLGVRYQWEFSKRNRFTNDAAIKTDIERTSDWRLNHVAAVQAGLNSILSLKVSHEVNYRNEPVPGFTRADTVTSAAIIATF